jgi:hypothetical protein
MNLSALYLDPVCSQLTGNNVVLRREGCMRNLILNFLRCFAVLLLLAAVTTAKLVETITSMNCTLSYQV